MTKEKNQKVAREPSDAMAEVIVKAEPPDDVLEQMADVDNAGTSGTVATAVKEEMDVEPTVLQPIDKRCTLPQYKQEPKDRQSETGARHNIARMFIKQEPIDKKVRPLAMTVEIEHIKDEQDNTERSAIHRDLLNFNDAENAYQCDICKSFYGIKGHLIQHMVTHTGGNHIRGRILNNTVDNNARLHGCRICKKRFSFKSALDRHMLIHTGEKPYVCVICKKSFSQSFTLKSHMVMHTGRKPYECEICEKRFTLKSIFKYHMQAHNGEEPYKCRVCGKKFTRESRLKIHMFTHTGEKPYLCVVCGKKFTDKSIRKRHMLSHEEKKYECGVCKKKFIQKSTLKRHMLTHTGEKPYACSICRQRFTRKSFLNVHKQSH